MRKKPIVLIISSPDPIHGPGAIAYNQKKLFSDNGYDCDLLTLYAIPDHPEILSVYPTPSNRFVPNLFRRLKKFLVRFVCSKNTVGGPHYFFYKSDQDPPIPVSSVLNAINRDYDWVRIVFHQGMLSFKTIEAIYDKLHCIFTFGGVDYAYMTGGCHFVGECENYKTGCGKCSVWGSDNASDFTYLNSLYRKRVYEKVRPILYGNSYMINQYRQSFILKDYDRIEKSYAILDEKMFFPRENVLELRRKFGIEKYDFIIFFGCQNIDDPRKGGVYLKETLSIISKSMTSIQKERTLLLTAGKLKQGFLDDVSFDVKNLGFLDMEGLCEAYSVSNVYVCPSVNDAGPSMVWQSLMCGTPVVGFEMGACIDAVKYKNTGYCARLRDSGDLANGILYIHSMIQHSMVDYNMLRERCASFAKSICTKDVRFQAMLDVYYKYSEGK